MCVAQPSDISPEGDSCKLALEAVTRRAAIAPCYFQLQAPSYFQLQQAVLQAFNAGMQYDTSDQHDHTRSWVACRDTLQALQRRLLTTDKATFLYECETWAIPALSTQLDNSRSTV